MQVVLLEVVRVTDKEDEDKKWKRIWNKIDKNLKPMMSAAHKAKTHTNYEMRKIPCAIRCKKWKEINTAAITEYHVWIDEELAKRT